MWLCMGLLDDVMRLYNKPCDVMMWRYVVMRSCDEEMSLRSCDYVMMWGDLVNEVMNHDVMWLCDDMLWVCGHVMRCIMTCWCVMCACNDVILWRCIRHVVLPQMPNSYKMPFDINNSSHHYLDARIYKHHGWQLPEEIKGFHQITSLKLPAHIICVWF